MRRFIDVIFVDPKIKRYVVLHQGKFWQLPRLNLSVNAWLLKKPYAGELSDIFVAKEQGVACAELSQTLKTYDLPPQLHGQSAIGFLGWWQTNDYKWLSSQDVLLLDAQDNPPSTSTPKNESDNTPAGFKVSVSVNDGTQTQVVHSQVVATPRSEIIDLTPPNMSKEDLKGASVSIVGVTATAVPSGNATAQNPTQSNQNTQINTQNNTSNITPVTPSTPAPKTPAKSADDEGDFGVFDNLLNELTEEILHPH